MSCKLVRLTIIVYVFTFFPFEIHAESLLVLSDAQEEYPLGKYLSVLEDASGKLTINDVSQPEYHDQYRTFNEDTPNLGFSKSVFWVRLHLKNESNLNVWLLDQRFANTHYLDLYVASEDEKTYKITESGNLRPYSNRKIPHRRIIFKLPLESGQQRTLYLRFQSHAAISLSLQLWSESALANADRTDLVRISPRQRRPH